LIGVFLLSGRGIARAKEAVDDSIGVARDDEMAAGTDCDLMSLARLAVRSANEISAGAGVELDGGNTFGGVLTGFAAGFVGVLHGFCTLTFSPVCEDHSEATEVTLPPRPPRADRISYFTSGLGVGGKVGKRGETFEDIIAALFAGPGRTFFGLILSALGGCGDCVDDEVRGCLISFVVGMAGSKSLRRSLIPDCL